MGDVVARGVMCRYDAGARTHKQELSCMYLCVCPVSSSAGEPICPGPERMTANFTSTAALMNSLLTYAAVPWPCPQLGCGGSTLDRPCFSRRALTCHWPAATLYAPATVFSTAGHTWRAHISYLSGDAAHLMLFRGLLSLRSTRLTRAELHVCSGPAL